MGTDRLRVLLLGVTALGLIVASTLFLDWFVITGTHLVGVDTISIDLRSVSACADAGPCGSVDIGKVRGMYPIFARATMWGTLAFAALVLFQVGSRLLQGVASETASKRGYMYGACLIALAGATAYFFGPDVGSIEVTQLGFSLEVERTWSPLLLMLGDGLGILALYYALQHAVADERAAYVPLAEARVVAPTVPLPTVTPLPPARPSASIPGTAAETGSRPLPTIPESCRNKLAYAAAAIEITRGGLDARREDGETPLVMWRDIVGAVARRLPDALDGATFVDIVSNAGATLRVLPWTRLTGERPDGADSAERARALVRLVVERCPDAKLDRATQAFLDEGQAAAQLPDEAMLAAHDERLA